MPGKGIAVWAGAGLSVPLLVLALVAIGGALGDFFTSYPGQLKTFKELGHPGGSIGGLLRNDQQEIALVTGGVLAGVVLLVMAWRREGRGLWSLRKPVAWAFIYLGGAIFCVVWSGKNYPHYFLFWVHPICLCLGVLAATVCGKRSDAGENRDEPRVAGFAPWCCVAPVLVAQLSMLVLVAPAHPHAGRVAKYLEAPKEGVVQAILQVAQPGDRMTVWGMTPSFYVDSGLAPGTRDAMTQMQILKTSRQAYYRERFMADLKKSRPKFFVDTDSPYLMMTGGSYVDYVKLPQHGHEVFPELARQRGRQPTRHQGLVRRILECHRLVEQQQRRALQRALRQGDALAFAARELEHRPRGQRLDVQRRRARPAAHAAAARRSTRAAAPR